MRPKPLVYFDWLYGFSLVLSAIGMALQPANPEVPFAASAPIIGITYAIALFIWFAISLRASNVMRWIFSVLTVVNLVGILFMISNSAELQGLELALNIINAVIDVVCVFMLFSAESKDWFASKGSRGVVDPSVFR